MAVTSTAADSAIDICARALILIGAEPITSFDDGNNEALVASNVYEDIARATLTSTRWRFATNQAVLNRLSDAPTARYTAAYQLPDDWLMTHAVTVRDTPVEYQTYGDKIYANEDETSDVVLDYTFRVDEVYWPSYFSVALELELARVFAFSIARDAPLANLMAQQANIAMMKARTTDSQQQTTRKLNTSRFITQRRS